MTGSDNQSLTATKGSEGKDTKLMPSERGFFELFKEGGAYSAKELMNRFDVRDPRGVIRFLRKKGLAVTGRWTRQGGRRFKLYSLEQGQSNQLNLFD